MCACVCVCARVHLCARACAAWYHGKRTQGPSGPAAGEDPINPSRRGRAAAGAGAEVVHAGLAPRTVAKFGANCFINRSPRTYKPPDTETCVH
jgi:hypothetical protein